ncbi:prolyl oligopeptidase family serine peptidase [Nocardioides gansuensis]|nr:prolyl oligopeptidase family serine peptidase [Nocardioides gansuensis]
MTTLPLVETPRIPVVTSYHGVDVTEEYRWLEDGTSDDTIAWTKAQHHLTRTYYDAVPWRDTLRARVEQLLKAERTTYRSLMSGGSTYFALKEQTPRQQPFVVALTDLGDTAAERIVVDPNAIDPSGETAIDWFVPSPDGGRVAVSLSEHGTEDGSLHVFDVETGEVLDEPIPHVNLLGGSMAWRHDGSGFWYTRCADPAGFRQQVWLREIGGAQHRLDVAEGFADEVIAENVLSASLDGRWLMDRVQKGDGGDWQVFIRSQDPDGAWWQLADIPDKCAYAVLGSDAVYVLSRRDAPHGKVLRLPLTEGATVADSREIVPPSHLVIEDFAVTHGTLWVADMDGGPQQLRAFDLDGGLLSTPEIPPVSSVSSYFARLSRLGPDRIAWRCESFTEPPTWWVAADGEAPRPTALATTSPVDLSGYEVTREFAVSRDGTHVPLNIIAAPGSPRDGTAPALLTAYGGYGISLVPTFDPERLLWLEQGGVLAIANIRGGGEYGQEWHHAGRLATKQNCFDDFIACADHLNDTGITSRGRLAIIGGSNGGLLMGAVLTQRPDIARAVVAAVPVMDSLRSETTTNGKFNTTEFGTVEDPETFTALLAYSPYHNVVDGTRYPAVLMTAGENDTRVDAWHAKKMTARLQAATSSGQPVLVRLEATGHLTGSLDQSIEETTDIYTFLFDQLGLGSQLVAAKRQATS